jgi:hypothetical protein
MSVFLNAMDGVKESYGQITIFTANDSKKFLQPRKALKALLRPGRVDKLIEVGYCTPTQIIKMYAVFFPDAEHLDINKLRFFQDLTPAVLGELLMQHSADQSRDMLYGIKPLPADPEEKPIDEEKHDEAPTAGKQKKRTTRKVKSESQSSKKLTLAQIKKRKKHLQSRLQRIGHVLEQGDKAAIDWHQDSQLWLKKFTEEDSQYQSMIDNYHSRRRGRPPKKTKDEQSVELTIDDEDTTEANIGSAL